MGENWYIHIAYMTIICTRMCISLYMWYDALGVWSVRVGLVVYMSTLSYIPFAYLHVTDEFILSVLLAHEYQIPITSTILDIFIATSSCQIKKKKWRKKICYIQWMAMRVNAHVVNQWRRHLKVKELLLHLCQKQKQTGRSFITGWVCRLFQTPRHCIYI